MRSRLDLPPWFFRWPTGLGIAALSLLLLTSVLKPFLGERHIVDVTLLYLLLTLVLSAVWGFRVGVPAAVAANLLVNFFFVPPLYTFTVQEPENAAALLLFLAVSAVGAVMLSLLRRQVTIAKARNAETEVFLGLSRAMARATTPKDGLNQLCIAVSRALSARSCAILRQTGGDWAVLAASGDVGTLSRDELSMATGALTAGVVRQPGRRGRETVTFVPFGDLATERGVLRIAGELRPPPRVEAPRLLQAFADEASVAVHRALLAQEARRVESLRRADELKSALLSSVSHDLRSPLTAIKAAVGSLRDEKITWGPDDERAFLSTIESQTDRLTGTIDGLLQMSRLEGGAVQPKIESIEAEPLLEEIAAATKHDAQQRDIQVEAPRGCWLRADYALISQSLINLTQNAARYSTPGGPIRLKACCAARHVLLEVGDSGPGIPEADLPHIFEKFYRGSKSSDVKGTGLGLSIVKAMVELCGGTIDVSSSRSGTTFRIALPVAVAPA
jgi:two-component system sensor histidine kinase KdpD